MWSQRDALQLGEVRLTEACVYVCFFVCTANTCIEYQSKASWTDGGQRLLALLPKVRKWAGMLSGCQPLQLVVPPELVCPLSTLPNPFVRKQLCDEVVNITVVDRQLPSHRALTAPTLMTWLAGHEACLTTVCCYWCFCYCCCR